MYKKLMLTAAAVVLAVMPQQANAQFLKELGKVLKDVGEEVLKDVTTPTTTTTTTSQANKTTTKAQQSASTSEHTAKNPKIQVKVADCWRMGKYVWIQLTLNNQGEEDKTTEFYNDWQSNTTAVYDANGEKYPLGFVVDGSFINPVITNFISARCPSGVPVKVYVIASRVSQETKTIKRLDFTMDQVVTTFRDISIREPQPNTNRLGLVCTSPNLLCYFKSCTRTGSDWTVTFTLTPGSDLSIHWIDNKIGIYDNEGNTYKWSLDMPNMSYGNVQLLSQTPGLLKLTVKDVPASVTKLHTLLLPFSINFFGRDFNFEIRMSGLAVGEKSEVSGESTSASATNTSATEYILGNGKLGPIKKGAAASTFPKQVEGLYDKFETKKEEFYDNEEAYTAEYIDFTKAGKLVFRANIDEGKVAFITLLEGSSNIKTPDGIYVEPIMKGTCSPATAHTPIPSLLMTSLTQTSLKKPPTSSRTQKSPKSHIDKYHTHYINYKIILKT